LAQRIEDLDNATRLRLLIDAVVDYAIYMIGLDGKVLTWNSGARRLKGYRQDEIIGRHFEIFFTPEDQVEGLPQRALRTATREGKFEAEGWRVRKDGSRFWALGVLDPVKDDSGDMLGFVKVTRDLTERKLAHQALVESEQRYRRLIEAVVDYAIFQLDAEGKITSWNPGAQRIKGYAAAEIIGKHFSLFYSERDRAAGVPALALKKAREEGKYEAEGTRVRKDGSEFQASVVIDPIRNEAGDVIGYAKITRDITERLKAQEALRASQEQLAAAQKMEAVGQLSGGIAHDFNNLLMIVLGNIEGAQRHIKAAAIEDANLNRSLASALRGAQRASALTSRLLAFSRRQPLNPKALDVNKFLSGSVDFLQRSLGETVEIEAVGAGGLWPIEIDANHLEIALVNLAINARDAMPDGGKLTIEASNIFLDEGYANANPEASRGQYVVISVSDTGTGMPPAVINRAFEPFFTTKELGHGTGLGLSQVYGFVKQSGGHIKIYSEEGEGTTVKMYYPRLPKRNEGDVAEAAKATAHGEQGETILVVEDDEDLRNYISETLRDLGYGVLEAANAKAAIALLNNPKRRIDLLLTDVVMPGQNGRELAKLAQGKREGLRVLFMTGYSRNAIVHHGRLDEGVELLQKPITRQVARRAELRGLRSTEPTQMHPGNVESSLRRQSARSKRG